MYVCNISIIWDDYRDDILFQLTTPNKQNRIQPTIGHNQVHVGLFSQGKASHAPPQKITCLANILRWYIIGFTA